MTIRFQCGSCSQPIEVDDEWSAKPVACPYCRKTVTAPIESTLGDPAAFQAAVPVETGPPGIQPIPTDPNASPHPRAKNTLAIVSLVLAISAVAMFLACGILAAGHEEEFKEFARVSTEATNYAEQVKLTNELLQANPDAMGMIVPAALLFLCGLGTNLAAIVCGIISSRRPVRRGLAITALAISFLPILLFF